MKTIFSKPLKCDERNWVHFDASGKTLGRLATEVAVYLKGKNKPSFSPHIDNGDYVVVTNIEKIVTTGRKELQKEYYRHSGHMGHLKVTTLEELRDKKPFHVLKFAVRGMLPKNKHRKTMLSRLYQYKGDEHEHTAQKPTTITL